MVSNIQRYFTLKYYAWFDARKFKTPRQQMHTGREGIWINSNIRLSIIVLKHSAWYFNITLPSLYNDPR